MMQNFVHDIFSMNSSLISILTIDVILYCPYTFVNSLLKINDVRIHHFHVLVKLIDDSTNSTTKFVKRASEFRDFNMNFVDSQMKYHHKVINLLWFGPKDDSSMFFVIDDWEIVTETFDIDVCQCYIEHLSMYFNIDSTKHVLTSAGPIEVCSVYLG